MTNEPLQESPKSKILIVEDEREIARFIELELQCDGYEVHVAHDGMVGLTMARELSPDLVILDWMLPNLDGLTLCRRLRQNSKVPIMMLTVKSEISHRVEGLDSGANDYLVKPFDLEELMARIRVQLRSQPPTSDNHLAFAHVMMKPDSHEVWSQERLIHLSPTEYGLLKLFLEHPRQALTRKFILDKVWGWDFEGEDNVLDVYIRYLRQKLEQNNAPRVIQTIRGVGYMLKDVAN